MNLSKRCKIRKSKRGNKVSYAKEKSDVKCDARDEKVPQGCGK